MDPMAAKYIGAGIACIGMGGVGVGTIFGNYLAAALRNPSAAQGQFGNLIFGFAVTEALGIFSLLIALLLLVRPVTNCEARASPPRGPTASPPEPAMADEHATMTGATPPSEHGGGARGSRRKPSPRNCSGCWSASPRSHALVCSVCVPRPVTGDERCRHCCGTCPS
jgi:F-type H+-transporting ATPase subunit c